MSDKREYTSHARNPAHARAQKRQEEKEKAEVISEPYFFYNDENFYK